MTGYREHSFEPYTGSQSGRPLRPYNWVQWTGVVMLGLSMLAYAYYFADGTGLVPETRIKPLTIGLPLLFAGMALVYSRREEPVDPAPELAAARKRWLIIIVAVCAVILGLAAALDLSGAK